MERRSGIIIGISHAKLYGAFKKNYSSMPVHESNDGFLCMNAKGHIFHF